MSDEIRILSSAGRAIGETVRLSDGTPIRRFKRFVAKIGGRYEKRGWNEPLHITDAYANHLLSTFNDMKAVGHPVKITMDHRDSDKAENVVGDAVDAGIERVGDEQWLSATVEVRGSDAIATAERNKDVSMEIWPEVQTGSGKVFKNAIKAITFTPIPVVGGQPIAASLASDIPVYKLSMETTMNDDLKNAIANLAGVKPEAVTESSAVALIEGARMTAANEIKKLSTETEPDLRYLSLAARTGEAALDALSRDGVCDVATVDGLKKLSLGTKDGDKRHFSRIALLLSTQDDEAPISFCESLASLFRNNKPVATGPKLFGQFRDVPDGDVSQKGVRKVKSPYTGNEVEIHA